MLCSLNVAQNRQSLHQFNLGYFSLTENSPRSPRLLFFSPPKNGSPLPKDPTRNPYLQRVEFQAENILIRAADLGKLYERILNATSKGDCLTQQRWVIPKFVLQEARESHFVAQHAKTSDKNGNTGGIWCSGKESRDQRPTGMML